MPLKSETQEGKLREHVDVESSIKQLKSEIDALRFDLLPNQLYSLWIGDILDYLEGKNLGFQPKRLFKEESEETSLWQNSLSLDSIRKIRLIDSFSCYPKSKDISEDKCVQIQDLGIIPSKAFNSEIESFVNLYIRNLQEKIFRKKQFHADSPNIIVGQWSHWIQTLGGYYQNTLNCLASRIKTEVLTPLESECISGVAIFTAICPIAFDKARYITNVNAKTSSKLTQQDLADLGFNGMHWFL